MHYCQRMLTPVLVTASKKKTLSVLVSTFGFFFKNKSYSKNKCIISVTNLSTFELFLNDIFPFSESLNTGYQDKSTVSAGPQRFMKLSQ